MYYSFRSWSRMLKMLEPLKWSFYATITAMTQRNYTIQSLINSRSVLSDVPVLFDFLYHEIQSHINCTLSSKAISTIPLGLLCFNFALAVPRSNLVINVRHHFICTSFLFISIRIWMVLYEMYPTFNPIAKPEHMQWAPSPRGLNVLTLPYVLLTK